MSIEGLPVPEHRWVTGWLVPWCMDCTQFLGNAAKVCPCADDPESSQQLRHEGWVKHQKEKKLLDHFSNEEVGGLKDV